MYKMLFSLSTEKVDRQLFRQFTALPLFGLVLCVCELRMKRLVASKIDTATARIIIVYTCASRRVFPNKKSYVNMAANIKISSFQKRIKPSNPNILGTKISAVNSTLNVSFGVTSLDQIIGSFSLVFYFL